MRCLYNFLLAILISCYSTFLYSYPNNNTTTNSIINTAFGSCGGIIATPVDCATGCHEPPGTVFNPVITLAGPSPVERSTSGAYSISSSEGSFAGFNLKVVNNADAVVGALSETDPNALIEINTLGQSMIRHTQPTASRSWTYNWQAPNASGTFQMCYCVNSVDGNANGIEFDGIGLDGDNPVCGSRSITVNNKPVAVDDAISLDEDTSTSFNVLTLLNNLNAADSDTENDTLRVESYSNDNGKPGLNCSIAGTNPSCSMNANPASYDSLDDDEPPGVLTFNYSLSDSNWTDADTGTVTITINGVNDAPVAVNDSISVNIGATATTLVGGATSVVTNDTDVDANEAIKNAVLVDNVQFGSLTLNTNGTFSYTHNGSNNLSDSFTYRVFDGTVNSNNIATVTINVTNTSPTAVDDLIVPAVDEGGFLNFTVLGNDSDPETGNQITIVTPVSNITNGSAVLVQPDQSITFQHDGSETSTAGFQYRVSDGFLNSNLASVTLSVNPINDAPVANGEAIAVDIAGTVTVLQDGITGSVLSNDTDAENSTLNAVLVSPPLSASAFTLNPNGTFSYTHDGSPELEDSFSYRANDGALDSNTATVNISIANSRPTAVDDSATVDEGGDVTINVLANDTDPETTVPTEVDSVINVINGTAVINSDQTVTFTHNGSETTTASFEYFANDNVLNSSLTATVTITVNPVNDAPMATADAIAVDIAGTATVLQDGVTASVLANDTDAENNPLAAIIVNPPGFASAFILNQNGSFSYTHDGSNNLVDSFSYKANDGALDSNIVNVPISIANTPPTAVNDSVTVAEGGSISINVLGNDSDPETSVPALITSISNVINGSALINADQSISFTHDGSETSTASFQYVASDGFLDSPTAATVNIIVTAVNDAPSIAALSDQTAIESLPMAIITAVGFDVDDANDGINLSYSLTNAPEGMLISNDLMTPGQISWTPPQTRVFNQLYGPIGVSVQDGLEDGVSAASTTFSVTVSPPDADNDLVPDYDDFCPAIADASNADNDGDATAGSDTDANDTVGGDLCDSDDDNDGMPDSYELENNLDPLDEADANQDKDGDGVSNRDEFLAGSNPLFPTVTIDSTGYLTTHRLSAPPASQIHPQATVLTPGNKGPYRPGINEIVWVASNAAADNLASSTQVLNVRPRVNFSANQSALEGNNVTVTASLNGNAVSYPVVVNYTVSGTAGSSDHDAISGSLSIENNALSASITFTLEADELIDADETVVFTIDSVTNGVIGNKKQSTVFIREGNIPPRVELQLLQNNLAVSSGFMVDGEVTVMAMITDANTDQSHELNWQATDNALSPPEDLTTTSWTFNPAEGVYAISLEVRDNGQPAQQAQVKRLFRVTSADPPELLPDVDTDGDGITDDIDGYDDIDQDGIANYLDDQGDPHLLQDQSASQANTYLLQSEPGLKLRVGNTANAAGISGAAITDETIASFGGDRGSTPLNANDQFEHVSGIYDFEISQLNPGDSALLVIPLQTAIPLQAQYRKFDANTGWRDFVSDGVNNRLFSAEGELGACPEPGSLDYTDGLNYLHVCLQLLIEDGGPNDLDGIANGVIRDPGTLGVKLTDPVEAEVEKSGAVSLWFIFSLVLLSLISLSSCRLKR